MTAKSKKPAAPSSTAGAGATSITLGDLCERYLKRLEKIGKSRGTVFSYSIDLGIATRHFGKDRAVDTITKDEVAAYLGCAAVTKKRGGASKAKPSIDKARRVFRFVLEFAAAQGLLAESPLPVVEPTATSSAAPVVERPVRKRKAAAPVETEVATAAS